MAGTSLRRPVAAPSFLTTPAMGLVIGLLPDDEPLRTTREPVVLPVEPLQEERCRWCYQRSRW